MTLLTKEQEIFLLFWSCSSRAHPTLTIRVRAFHWTSIGSEGGALKAETNFLRRTTGINDPK